jgi:hypothetical protein
MNKRVLQTLDGILEWVAMPFGLCNAPATFQRMMTDILHKFDIVYLDDVYAVICTLEDMEHLRLVLQRFKDEGLK